MKVEKKDQVWPFLKGTRLNNQLRVTSAGNLERSGHVIASSLTRTEVFVHWDGQLKASGDNVIETHRLTPVDWHGYIKSILLVIPPTALGHNVWINCTHEWQAANLCYLMDAFGLRWFDGRFYPLGHDWDDNMYTTCYNPAQGMIGTIASAKESGGIVLSYESLMIKS